MSFFLFHKNSDNLDGTLYKIAENQSDLNNVNGLSNYKIIEDTQENFTAVKFGEKFASKYNNNIIIYIDTPIVFKSKIELKNFVDNFKIRIKNFIDNNPNHSLLNRWNSYYDQLNNLNLDNILYPLNKSLEKYFNDQGQPSYNILQIP